MPTKQWPLQSDVAAMRKVFGNPDANNDGAADPSWAAKHLTTIKPPYTMYYAGKPVKAITVNVACSDALLNALKDILALYKTPAALAKAGVDQFGGVYNFRVKRGGSSLSMHAYACAIDLDPVHNPFKSRAGTMPPEVVAIFKRYGAEWGGDWGGKSRDPMHYQFARVK